MRTFSPLLSPSLIHEANIRAKGKTVHIDFDTYLARSLLYICRKAWGVRCMPSHNSPYFTAEPEFVNVYGAQGLIPASLCRMAYRYDSSISSTGPTDIGWRNRFLVSLNVLCSLAGQYDNPTLWKTGRKLNRCLEFLSHRQIFHQCCTKFMLVTPVLFLNHTGRKKNFDATDGNKSDPSVEKIFPFYLIKSCWHCSIWG